MSETAYLKISCSNCSNHIEFPAEMRGQTIDCPHCSLSLSLELPEEQPPTPPHANIYQRLRALNSVKPKPASDNSPEGYLK